MLLVLCIVSLVLYRNWRYEQELDSLLWKIDYKELQVHESDKDSSEKKQTRVRIPLFNFINISFVRSFFSIQFIIQNWIPLRFLLLTGHASPNPNEPSEPQFEPRLWFPLFKHFHADRNLQGTAVRHQESEEEIRWHHAGDENGTETGEWFVIGDPKVMNRVLCPVRSIWICIDKWSLPLLLPPILPCGQDNVSMPSFVGIGRPKSVSQVFS